MIVNNNNMVVIGIIYALILGHLYIHKYKHKIFTSNNSQCPFQIFNFCFFSSNLNYSSSPEFDLVHHAPVQDVLEIWAHPV